MQKLTPAEALEILDLERDASQSQIKEAYRDLAKVWHPDRFQKDPRLLAKAEATLKQVNAANEALKAYRPSVRAAPPSDQKARPRRPEPTPPSHPRPEERTTPPRSPGPDPRSIPGWVGGWLILLVLGAMIIWMLAEQDKARVVNRQNEQPSAPRDSTLLGGRSPVTAEAKSAARTRWPICSGLEGQDQVISPSTVVRTLSAQSDCFSGWIDVGHNLTRIDWAGLGALYMYKTDGQISRLMGDGNWFQAGEHPAPGLKFRLRVDTSGIVKITVGSAPSS